MSSAAEFITVSYATAGIDGKPHFSYQDLQHTRDFSGAEIRTVNTEVGTLVSVTIRLTVDTGGTTFSILVPRVNIPGEVAVPIQTVGITTIHKSPIVPIVGQRDFYTVTPMTVMPTQNVRQWTTANCQEQIYKGWMQTFITLTRDPWRLAAELGVQKSVALGLMMTNMVVAPTLWPFFATLVVHRLSSGALAPASPLELAMAVLWMSAVVFGAGSILWLALLGMNRRRLMKIWPFLPLVPLYYLLTSVAAWLALYDLILRPYHWHKTEHGLAKSTRQTLEPAITTDGL